MVVPGARLQGSTGSGSAPAAVSEVPTPVPAAPARSRPRPSKARRSSRPLPALSGVGETSLLRLRVGLLVMGSSFEAWRPAEHLQPVEFQAVSIACSGRPSIGPWADPGRLSSPLPFRGEGDARSAAGEGARHKL